MKKTIEEVRDWLLENRVDEDGEFEYVKPIRLKGKIYNVGSDEEWKNY